MTRIIDKETGEVTGEVHDGINADATEVDPAPFESATLITGRPSPGQLAVVQPGTLAELLDQRKMPFIAWASALLKNTQFDAASEEDPSAPMLVAILAAETSEQAMAVSDMTPSETLCPKEPGSHSPLLRFTDATPLQSSFDDGPPVFCVVSYTVLATGEQGKTSIGARAVQAVLLKHMWENWMPFDGILARRLKPTRKGFYPMNLEAGG